MPTGYCRECGRPFTDLRRRLCGACYQRARKQAEFQGWVDTTVIREHIAALHAAGLGQRRIAQLAGVNRSVIRNLLVGRRAQDKSHAGPAQRCLLRTAQDILAVPIPPTDSKAVEWRELRVALNPRRRSSRRSRKPNWLERYTELKLLGYSDIDIMRKFDVTAEAMLRQQTRYGITPHPSLLAESRCEKDRRRSA